MPGMDWNLPIFVLMAVEAIATSGVALYAWIDRRRRATKTEIAEVAKAAKTRIDAIELRLDDHRQRLTTGEGRFQRIEDRLDAMPSANAVSELKIAMTQLTGEIRVTNQRLDGFEEIYRVAKTQVDRMEDYMRAQK